MYPSLWLANFLPGKEPSIVNLSAKATKAF